MSNVSKSHLEKIKVFFESKRNRQRLIEFMKKGTYIEFSEELGYVYAIKIGEMQEMDLMLRVSTISGEFTIHDAFLQPTPGVEKELALA